MFVVHGTPKLRDRVKGPAAEPVHESTTALGAWYATALFWKPHVALFVNELTLLPVLMPLTPAVTVLARFPTALVEVLRAHRVDDTRSSSARPRRCPSTGSRRPRIAASSGA